MGRTELALVLNLRLRFVFFARIFLFFATPKSCIIEYPRQAMKSVLAE